MSAMTMNAHVLIDGGRQPRSGCERKRARRAARPLRARIALAVLALAALGAGLYGERWVLLESPLPAFEYVAATCAALAVQDEQPSNVCSSNDNGSERNNHE